MARFIAIPVGQGDAFYLERDDLSVLIDGGGGRANFASLFHRTTGADRVNVLVCTHNDADHSSGVLGFLEAGLACDEVWLPGQWLGAMKDILKTPEELLINVASDIAVLPESTIAQMSDAQAPPLEAFAMTLEGSASQSAHPDGPHVDDSGWPSSVAVLLEEAGRSEGSSLPDPHWPLSGVVSDLLWNAGPAGARLAIAAFAAGVRIRQLAVESYHRGFPVRWFQFGTSAPSDGLPGLQPLNARAIRAAPALSDTLLATLALTVSNRESLVFWSPRTEKHPGVLFSADSDLSMVGLPPGFCRALVTAPHHGSEANSSAYDIVAAATGADADSITWVRSDGRFKTRPGPTYLALPGRRLCTLCRTGVTCTRKVPVRLHAHRGGWARSRGTVECTCG